MLWLLTFMICFSSLKMFMDIFLFDILKNSANLTLDSCFNHKKVSVEMGMKYKYSGKTTNDYFWTLMREKYL